MTGAPTVRQRPRRAAGVALPAVLVFSAVVASVAAAALQGIALETRSAAYRQLSLRVGNYAETVLDALAARTAARWSDGGNSCAAERYCADDFPVVSRLLAQAPPDCTVSVALVPSPLPAPPQQSAATASSALRYGWRLVEAQVRVEGPAPTALALGLALPRRVARGSDP